MGHQLLITGSGKAPLDFTKSLLSEPALTIQRVLNKPSILTFSFLLDVMDGETPRSLDKVAVSDALGNVLFTGYVADEPTQRMYGFRDGGLAQIVDVTAMSDDILLDSTWTTTQTISLGQSAQETWQMLSMASGDATTQVATGSGSSGRLELEAGTTWSQISEALANSTQSSYRVLNGEVLVSPVGNTTHVPDASDVTPSSADVNALKLLANDVTICGEMEPRAYVTELFQGDGATSSFVLTEDPYVLPALQKNLIVDEFQGEEIDTRLWMTSDPSGHLSLGAGGLTCNGGTGRDAETAISSVQQLEMGGLITAEANGVLVQSGSAGFLLGFFNGGVQSSNCFLAFQVATTSSGEAVSVSVNGSTSGSSFSLLAGHIYTFRLRVYSPDVERVRQTYRFLGVSGSEAYGGDIVEATGYVEAEIQDVTTGLPGAPVVLYSGFIGSLPPVCNLVAIQSGSMNCSIKSITCIRSAPAWVDVTPPGESAAPQYMGTTAQGAACTMTTTGEIRFYPSSIPSQNALIQVNYRTKARAVARKASAASGSAQTQMLVGTVSAPAAWSSVDCENAAQALLDMAATEVGALQGTWKFLRTEQGADIWPGDYLQLSTDPAGGTSIAVIRDVTLSPQSSVPPTIRYEIKFANEWAESLAIKLTKSVPSDVVLPDIPSNSETSLTNLTGLQVSGVSSATLTIATGAQAPINGGFEIRRRDETFGPGTDSDLVLRTSTSSIQIPRLAAVEQYYVRMYDGSTPPNYSSQSAAIFVNIPL